MDIFKEQIIKIKPTLKTAAIKVLIWAAAAMILAAVIYFGFGQFLPIAAIGLFWGALTLCRKLDVEYEYILTNGDLDIDKIIGKRERKRILALKCADIEKIGKYNGEMKLPGKLFICCNPGDEAYYIIARERDEGTVCIVMAPDDKMKEAIKHFVPRIIQMGAFSE